MNKQQSFKAYKAVLRDQKGIYTDGMGNRSKCYWEKNKHYTVNNTLELCNNGIHFFRYLCFAVDYLKQDNEIWEVEICGDVVEDTFKGCTNDIVFIKKIPKKEINRAIRKSHNSGYYNSGNHNSGYYNSGDRNSGDCNSGDHNSGDHNSGDFNSGDCNSGEYNSGDFNSGDFNSGNHNSGSYNSGNCNSGSYNSGDYNSGDGYVNYFCTNNKYFLFDIEVREIPEQIKILDMSWFNLEDKTYKEAWAKCPKEILNILRNIPEFNTQEAIKKFKKITGLDLFGGQNENNKD